VWAVVAVAATLGASAVNAAGRGRGADDPGAAARVRLTLGKVSPKSPESLGVVAQSQA
jgi:hypothetical protein